PNPGDPMTNLPEPADQTALRDRIAAAIREFPFDDFGLDDLSYLLDSTPDTQEWVPKLAAAVLAVLPAPADHTTPPAWVDGHPQLEAIAAAVWEQCGRSDNGACVDDDPRNIAVAALSAVRNTADDQAAENKRLRAKVFEWQGSYLDEVKVRQERD